MTTKEQLAVLDQADAALDKAVQNMGFGTARAAIEALRPVVAVLREVVQDTPNPPTRRKRAGK